VPRTMFPEVRAYRAVVAVGAVLGPLPKAAKELGTRPTPLGMTQDVVPLAGSAPQRAPTGEDWRWFQDYGGGKSMYGSPRGRRAA